MQSLPVTKAHLYRLNGAHTEIKINFNVSYYMSSCAFILCQAMHNIS